MEKLRYLIRVARYGLLHAVGQELLLHARCIHFGNHDGAAVGADILRIVADQSVTLAGDATLELAGRSRGEPLCSGLLGLHLRHFGLLLATVRPAKSRGKSTARRLNQ